MGLSNEHEQQLENVNFDTLEPTDVTLPDLLSGYACKVTTSKRDATPELTRLRRLMNALSVHSVFISYHQLGWQPFVT